MNTHYNTRAQGLSRATNRLDREPPTCKIATLGQGDQNRYEFIVPVDTHAAWQHQMVMKLDPAQWSKPMHAILWQLKPDGGSGAGDALPWLSLTVEALHGVELVWVLAERHADESERKLTLGKVVPHEWITWTCTDAVWQFSCARFWTHGTHQSPLGALVRCGLYATHSDGEYAVAVLQRW